MLVDVVRLRKAGQRLDPAAVREATPVRGLLSLTAERPGWYAGQAHAPLLAGLVDPGASQWLLPPLDHACVRKIVGRGMLIVGVEEWVKPVRQVTHMRQAWWVRPVLERAGKLSELELAPHQR